MFKHIFCQSIYQLAIMVIVVFFGHLFLPEEFDRDGHAAYSYRGNVEG